MASAFQTHKARLELHGAPMGSQVEQSYRRTAAQSDLDKLAENVYEDLNAISEQIEQHEEDVKTLFNSLMEASFAAGDFRHDVRAEINGLLARFDGLLARVNAIEERTIQKLVRLGKAYHTERELRIAQGELARKQYVTLRDHFNECRQSDQQSRESVFLAIAERIQAVERHVGLYKSPSFDNVIQLPQRGGDN